MNIKKVIHKNPKLLNLARISGEWAIQPFFLLIHLTLDCNCHCTLCYQNNDNFYLSKKGLIKPNDFEKILKDAKKNFFIKPLIHFFGGEPLLNPYFNEFLNMSNGYGFRSSITTNGILLNQYSKIILGSKLNQINVSIDDIGEKHDQIRRVAGCFEAVISNIKALRKKESSRQSKRKIININCLISGANHGRLSDLVRYFMANIKDIDVLSFQHSYFNSAIPKPEIDLPILTSQIRKIRKMKLNFSVLFIPDIRFNDLENYYNEDRKDIFKNTCNIPWLGLNIFPNLDVTPGGGVLGCNCVVGSLKHESLKEIWNNDLMRKFRKNIIKNGLPAICNRCCHRQYY
jgi:MoaA/NifB/PqqE/SkfB family radical SAM enzyme